MAAIPNVFVSRSVPVHLLRGLGATVLIALGVWLMGVPSAVRVVGAACAFAVAAVLMRGCPTCWMIGLVGTVMRASPFRRHARQALPSPD